MIVIVTVSETVIISVVLTSIAGTVTIIHENYININSTVE
jgi:hypothetical protein